MSCWARDGLTAQQCAARRASSASPATLGASAAGMQLLADARLPRRAATADLLVQAHLRPEPRVSLGQVLREHGRKCRAWISVTA